MMRGNGCTMFRTACRPVKGNFVSSASVGDRQKNPSRDMREQNRGNLTATALCKRENNTVDWRFGGPSVWKDGTRSDRKTDKIAINQASDDGGWLMADQPDNARKTSYF